MRDDPESLDESWLRPLLGAFAEIGDADAWPEPAEMLDGLIRASVRASLGNSVFRRSGDDTLLGAPDPFDHAQPDKALEKTPGLLALDLAIASGSADHVDRLIETPATGLGRTPAAWVSLVRHDGIDAAAEAIDRNWARAAPAFPEGVVYDERVHRRLPDLLARFEGQPMRVYAEAAFAVLPDPETDAPSDGGDGGPGSVWPDRPARVRAAAEKFRATEFGNDKLHEQTLLMLASAEPGLDALAEEIIAMVDGPPDAPSNRFTFANAGATPEEAMFLAAVRADLRRGETGLFGESMNAYADRATGNDYRLGQMVGRMMSIFSNEVVGRMGEIPPESLAGIRDLLADLLARAGLRSLMNTGWAGGARGSLASTHAALVFATADAEAYDEFVAGLELDDGSPAIDVDQLVDALAGLLARDGVPDENRLAAFRNAFTNGHVIERVGDHDYVFQRAFEKGLLSAGQIEAHGLEIGESIGNNAWMGLGFGANDAGLGELSDEAWRRALATQEDNDGRLHYLMHMIESERYELALAFLAEIDPESMEQRTRKERLTRRAERGIEQRDAAPDGEEQAPEASNSDGAKGSEP